MAEYGMTGAPAVIGLVVLVAIVAAVVWWNKRKVQGIAQGMAEDVRRSASRIEAKVSGTRERDASGKFLKK